MIARYSLAPQGAGLTITERGLAALDRPPCAARGDIPPCRSRPPARLSEQALAEAERLRRTSGRPVEATLERLPEPPRPAAARLAGRTAGLRRLQSVSELS